MTKEGHPQNRSLMVVVVVQRKIRPEFTINRKLARELLLSQIYERLLDQII